MTRDEKRELIEPGARLSVGRQCELLGLARSSWYYEPAAESRENLELMRRIDELYLEHPTLGSRMMAKMLSKEGIAVNRKRVQRLMRVMGIQAIYPRPRTTTPGTEHRVYPYLLRGVSIDRPNQAWSTDITYVPMESGYLYLTAVIDWHSRYVLSWRLSNTMDVEFCLEALEAALKLGQPEIFNTDQGSQYTSQCFVGALERRGIQISMDGRGRALDNIFIERLWRTVKYEEIYLKCYADGYEAERELRRYFRYYCTERPHSSLGYRTPAEVYALVS